PIPCILVNRISTRFYRRSSRGATPAGGTALRCLHKTRTIINRCRFTPIKRFQSIGALPLKSGLEASSSYQFQSSPNRPPAVLLRRVSARRVRGRRPIGFRQWSSAARVVPLLRPPDKHSAQKMPDDHGVPPNQPHRV